MASITLDGAQLVYRTPYHPQLVAALKAAIPATDRAWDKGRKAWLVAPVHGRTLADLTSQFLGEVVTVPDMACMRPQAATRILDVRYIGRTKDRGDGNATAFGWCDGGWSVIFPEPVLRQWFGASEQRPDEAPTLYAVLGLQQVVGALDIRSAYRRLARQWHPDVSKEPGSAEQFMCIQHAYEVLSNEAQRARYDAGLRLEASTRATRITDELVGAFAARTWHQAAPNGYRSPLRCGMIMATGSETIGRFVIETIHAWEDITAADGRVLVTSWPMGAETYEETWQ